MSVVRVLGMPDICKQGQEPTHGIGHYALFSTPLRLDMAILANIRLGRKNLPKTNSIAYIEHLSMTK